MANMRPTKKKDLPKAQNLLSQPEIEARFTKRRLTLKSACQKYGNVSALWGMRAIVRLPRFPPVVNVSVSYCPIPKTSSTTWKDIFAKIRGKMKRLKIPGVIPPSKTPDVRFVFVREPYSRLLSAYVDKLFSPHGMIWNTTGRDVIKNFRPNASSKSLECGHDVTFPEFIKYVISMEESGEDYNRHFVLSHKFCALCDYHYDYIGHLETIQEDMPYILKAIQSPVTYSQTFDSVTIQKNTRMSLNRMKDAVSRCIDVHEACIRLWKKWQIRGIIHTSQPFPLTREHTRDITPEDFAKAALSAVARSGEVMERRGQKGEAAREAYSGVDMADRDKLQRLLAVDCHMFGFDPRPPHVFPVTPHTSHTHFSYFDLYQ
ncbi:carbohydrate sulfotransferase 9-like [Littorina saxatilis]|uniref:Carbohydrate sulfotransferase n=1 Tax=Littorina saxatilis TaxID=31220 RepID=A0AAN9AU88_9CAEN